MACSVCVYTGEDCPDCGECICSCYCDDDAGSPYGDDFQTYNLRPAETGGKPLVLYGPHCSHDDCSWVTCDGSGLVEHPCGKPGCPHCGAPAPGDPEQWATVPARVAAMSPADRERVAEYLTAYPLVRRGPDDDYERLNKEIRDGIR